MRRLVPFFIFACFALFAFSLSIMLPVEPASQLYAVSQLHALISSQVLQFMMTVTLFLMVVGLMLASLVVPRRKHGFEGWDTSLEGNGGYPAARHSFVKHFVETLLQLGRHRLVPAPGNHVHTT